MHIQHILAIIPFAAAWPAAMSMVGTDIRLEKRVTYPKVPPPKYTTDRDNCGSHGKCVVFNAKDQFVDVRPGSGHQFQAPGTGDLRGECPGLNAAANHGFLPRNGKATIAQTIAGLGAAYSMSADLAAGLAAIAIAITGDPVAETWSIGAGFPGSVGLLGKPTGIVGSHNRYENDASIVRGDAYLHNGNVGYFEMHKFEHLYSLLGKENTLTHDKAAAQAYYTMEYSVLNNPYAFWEPFSGLVAPDAHNFVVNFMSNHSEANKGGVLTGDTLKSFFSVTGNPGSFVHKPGLERIPYNWYKRPSSEPMDTADTNVDTVVNNGMYPGIIKFGGNTGKVNSFVGIDTGNLTGGVYNSKTLLQGNNLACFFLQATQAGLSDSTYPLTEAAGTLINFLEKYLGPQKAALGCPQLASFNNALFAPYPGATYQ